MKKSLAMIALDHQSISNYGGLCQFWYYNCSLSVSHLQIDDLCWCLFIVVKEGLLDKFIALIKRIVVVLQVCQFRHQREIVASLE